MKYVCVVPYAYAPYFQEFIKTCKIPRENMLLINDTNPPGAIGIMKAHNMGIDFMKEKGADWLIVMSAAIRFGEQGGLDFLKILEQHPDHHVIHGASADAVESGNKVFGWHLVAFHRSVFETIGRWDENFSPYGFDDIDLSLRIRKGMPDVKWEGYPCDVTDTTMSHSINLAGVEAPSGPRILYFVEKWGRHPGAYQLGSYDTPFNDPEKSLAYWPPAPNGGQCD